MWLMKTISTIVFTPNYMSHLQNIDYVQFVDDFFSNLLYKNGYSPLFQPLPDMPLWSAYIDLDVYRCPTR